MLVTIHPTQMQQSKISPDIGKCLRVGWGGVVVRCDQKAWQLLFQRHYKFYFIILSPHKEFSLQEMTSCGKFYGNHEQMLVARRTKPYKEYMYHYTLIFLTYTHTHLFFCLTEML